MLGTTTATMTRTPSTDEVTAAPRRASSVRCVHHWVIEAPNGRESRGKCKNCGKAKVFANSTENVMWEQTNTLRNDLSRSVRVLRQEDQLLSDEQ
ncbi:MAG: hypothetical protein EXR66_07290 [Dehalococcoidia bacterium]|nr:hypothetical protein [Dehalococcoidia bacterium]